VCFIPFIFYFFSPIATNPKNNQVIELNNTINFSFVSTPSQDKYLLKIYSDSSLQNLIYESSIDHSGSFLNELTIEVWLNINAGAYFWRIETNSNHAKLKFSETSRFYLVNDLNNIVHQYPNPFNRRTVFEYLLISNSKVILDILNILGQKVTKIISYHTGIQDGEISARYLPLDLEPVLF
jgi:hypothetical protein